MVPQVRPAPDNPPAYSRYVARVYTASLRPVILFVTFLSFIFALSSGVTFIRYRNVDFETSKRKLYFLIIAILFFIVAGIEVFGLLATWKQTVQIMRIYALAAIGAFLISLAAEVFRLVIHFTTKTDYLNVCSLNEVGQPYFNVTSNGIFEPNTVTTGNLTEAQARSVCDSRFNRGTSRDIAWLLLVLIFGFIFVGLVGAFYQQVLHPSLLGVQYVQPTNIPMTPHHPAPWTHAAPAYTPAYGPPPGPPPSEERDPPFVPPTAYNYAYDNSSTPGFTPGYGSAPPGYEGSKEWKEEKEGATEEEMRGLKGASESQVELHAPGNSSSQTRDP